MPITVCWDDAERSVLRFDYVGRWTWEELYSAVTEANGLMDTVDHPVTHLIDLTQNGGVPSNLINHVQQLASLTHRNFEMTIIIGADRFIHMLGDLCFRLAGSRVDRSRYHWAESLDQARFMVQVYRHHRVRTLRP